MKHAVNGGLDQIGRVLRADDDIAELSRSSRRSDSIDREREHVSGLVLGPMEVIELANPRLGDELDREMAVADPGRPQRGRDSVTQVGWDVGKVGAQLRFVRSECSP